METRERAVAYSPDYAVHPGEYLEEVLESRGIKKRELAERLGISVKHLSQIVNAQAGMSAAMAVQLEMILGVSASIWNNLNADYELFQEREKADAAIDARHSWLAAFPVRDLKRLGFLPDNNDKSALIDALLRFFELPDTEQWNAFYGNLNATSFRKSPAFTAGLPQLAAWLRAGELSVRDLETAPYSRDAFKAALDSIRGFTIRKPQAFEHEMRRLCALSGVALAFVPEFEKTHVSGAARWQSRDRALIIMSLRHKSNDRFWFSFFHEAAHILLHGKKGVYIDDPTGYESDLEAEADRFARNFLVPEGAWMSFIGAGAFLESDVVAFARVQGIHPGIVVGRLQHERLIPYTWHYGLKEKYELVAPARIKR
jgi:HTH-type transcriptional regulator / antitoxin HigA